MTYDELLKNAFIKIEKAGLEKSVAKLLLMHYAKVETTKLYANLNQQVNPKVLENFNKGLKLYLEKKLPLQYIIKNQPFFGYDFYVDTNVLIPRYETEELVEHLIYYIEDKFKNAVKILDLGTGSGCIAITLDKELKNAIVTATDISEKALLVAKRNNQTLNASVRFLLGDLFEPLRGERFDIIVSNPPYIPIGEMIGETVKHEPEISLYGGADGLYYYQRIIEEAKGYLTENGLLAFEHAYNTAKQIKELALQHFPNSKVIQHRDLSGRDRITLLEVGEEMF